MSSTISTPVPDSESATEDHAPGVQALGFSATEAAELEHTELERAEFVQAELDAAAADGEKSEARRSIEEADRKLLIASREFASENFRQSSWHLLSTLAVLLAFGAVAAFGQATWLRGLASLMTGLTLVRMFILYHDYQHGSIFKGSPMWADLILKVYGLLMLTPPSVWKRSHDHHHRHNSKIFGASIGSFPIMTTENFESATKLERLEYRMARHPLVIVLGYFTVFMLGMTIRPLFMDPRRHLDAVLALVAHFGFIAVCVWWADWSTAIYAFILPTWIATLSGAYLFYIQHNFPGAKIRAVGEWSYTDAALKSSSFLELGPVLHWMTGNIGYHHVHHLNAKIPFYRLPEAMARLPALQSPTKTSLRIRDIIGCLRLKLWDASQDSLVSFSDARASR